MSHDDADSSVRFQPSAQTMADTESFDDEDDQSQHQHANRSAGKRKQTRNNRSVAPDESHGNNTSPPTPSIKAERAARGAGGKKAQHTDVAHHNSRSHSPPIGHSHSGKKQQRNKKNGGGGDYPLEERHHDTPKKRPMRSVDDVLSRIRYEIGSSPRASELMPHFTIAYVDRVWGDQEVAFTTFFESEGQHHRHFQLRALGGTEHSGQ